MDHLLQNKYFNLNITGSGLSIRSKRNRYIIKRISCSACFADKRMAANHLKLNLARQHFDDVLLQYRADYENSWFRISLMMDFSSGSPEIETSVISSWFGKPPDNLIHNENELLIEYIAVNFSFPWNLPLRELYLKNRVYRKNPPLGQVWLDKQGVSLGRGSWSFHIYHVPGISSLLYRRLPHKLTVFADHAHDHRFVKASQSTEDIVYTDCSHTVMRHLEEQKAGFRFLAGATPETQPLLWLHQKGHDATMIWTWHPDNSNLGSTLAVTMGNSSLDPDGQPKGGFAAYRIPVTKGVFYSTDNNQNISLFNHPDSEKYRKLIARLHDDFGFEITPHSASSHKSNKKLTTKALEYFSENFGNKNWIDHSGHGQRTTLSGDGSDQTSESYIIDLFEKYSIDYAWHYGSELKYLPGFDLNDDSHGLDILQSRRVGSMAAHTPIFWKHPSRLKHLVTWKTLLLGRLRHFPVTGLQWLVYFKRCLPGLINNHGISIIHDYPCWTYRKKYAAGNGYYKLLSEKGSDFYISDPEFDSLLAKLAGLEADRKLHCTTIKAFLDYLLSLDKVSFSFQDKHNTRVSNNSGIEIRAVIAFPKSAKPESDDLEFLRSTGCQNLYLLSLKPEASTMISTH